LIEKEQVAYYRNAVVVPELLTFIPIAFMVPFFPVLSRKYSVDKNAFMDTYRAGTKYLLFIIVPIVLFIFNYSEEIILLLFKEKYLLFVYASSIFNNALVASNLQNYWLLFSGLSCGLNILLNLFLIPLYGIEGAATATVISYGMFLLWGMILEKTRMFSIDIIINIVKPVIAGLIMFLFIIVLKQSLWISFLPAAVIYSGIFVILKGFGREDILFLKELLPRKYSIKYFNDDA